MAILGELDRAGLLDTSVHRIDYPDLKSAIAANDILSATASEEASTQRWQRPAANSTWNSVRRTIPTLRPIPTVNRGCIRDMEHPPISRTGLAVLFGNLAEDGCIVKTAGVDASILRFEGKARVFESQEEACEGILSGKVKAGDVVIICYEGPKGGPWYAGRCSTPPPT